MLKSLLQIDEFDKSESVYKFFYEEPCLEAVKESIQKQSSEHISQMEICDYLLEVSSILVPMRTSFRLP